MPSPLPDLLAGIRNLAPLPHVALRVLELSQRADVVPRELIGVIQTEPALTAKVLRLTNSAYYGLKRQIASLEEAGNLLGTSTLVNLVLTGCAARYFNEVSAGDDAARRRRWERSISQALAGSLLARVTQSTDKNRAYTAGLLQDIGELVLAPHAALRQAELTAACSHGLTRLEAEADVLGLSHAEVGAQLAQRWNFPDVLTDTIRCHHTPERATSDPALTDVVHLATLVVEELMPATASALPEQHATSLRALERLGLNDQAFAGLLESLARDLEQAREFVTAS